MDLLDISDIDDVPEDYACGLYGDSGLTCDDMAHLGFSCHYMETRRATDCSGCLCEEAILGYVKGDGSCPLSCHGADCAQHSVGWNQFSCEALESFDSFFGCDCSGCDEACGGVDMDFPGISYNAMDCNGNAYWTHTLADETCDEEVTALQGYGTGNPDDGYEVRTWYACLNCPELECDMGDCGDSCERDGSTCALPLNELCADEDAAHTPTKLGFATYCTAEALAAWDARTEAPTPAPPTEATVAADEEDGSFAPMTTAIFAVMLMMA